MPTAIWISYFRLLYLGRVQVPATIARERERVRYIQTYRELGQRAVFSSRLYGLGASFPGPVHRILVHTTTGSGYRRAPGRLPARINFIVIAAARVCRPVAYPHHTPRPHAHHECSIGLLMSASHNGQTDRDRRTDRTNEDTIWTRTTEQIVSVMRDDVKYSIFIIVVAATVEKQCRRS